MTVDDWTTVAAMGFLFGVVMWMCSREWPEEKLARQGLVLARLFEVHSGVWCHTQRLSELTGLDHRTLRRTLLQLMREGAVEAALVDGNRGLSARVTPTFRASSNFPLASSGVTVR